MTRYRGRGRWCSTGCVELARELRAILDGRPHGRYETVADRLGTLAVPGSPLDRLLGTAARLLEAREQRAEGNAGVGALLAIVARRTRRAVDADAGEPEAER